MKLKRLDCEIADFVKERNEALFSLDRAKIEAYMRKHGVDPPANDLIFWAGVHKAIMQITDAPFELKMKSYDWLMEHKFSPEIF